MPSKARRNKAAEAALLIPISFLCLQALVAVGGFLKGAAKRALPLAGGALGGYIGGPLGAKIGSGLAAAAVAQAAVTAAAQKHAPGLLRGAARAGAGSLPDEEEYRHLCAKKRCPSLHLLGRCCRA